MKKIEEDIPTKTTFTLSNMIDVSKKLNPSLYAEIIIIVEEMQNAGFSDIEIKESLISYAKNKVNL